MVKLEIETQIYIQNHTLFLELLATTDNLDKDEVNDATKTPLERPLEVANDSNKRSEIDNSESNDEIGKLEDDSSHDKNKQDTADKNLSALIVEMSSTSATNYLKDDVVTDPARDAERRVSKMDTKLVKEDIDKKKHYTNCNKCE